jgi:hypothetical protein
MYICAYLLIRILVYAFKHTRMLREEFTATIVSTLSENTGGRVFFQAESFSVS